ncbi:hypothetical protein [Vreelandella profundi]|uniref:hypothetical protein n=1 Tax=Vreelandella profundi TaxID=2852117 RepID=UPI001F37AB20|nr:hypothetical protein [Halomonas profundi]
MNNIKKIKKFTYSIRQHPAGGSYVQFDIHLQNLRTKIGLTPSDTTELWITYAEKPTAIADLVDDRTWEAHRKTILAMLANHYLTPFH